MSCMPCPLSPWLSLQWSWTQSHVLYVKSSLILAFPRKSVYMSSPLSSWLFCPWFRNQSYVPVMSVTLGSSLHTVHIDYYCNSVGVLPKVLISSSSNGPLLAPRMVLSCLLSSWLVQSASEYRLLPIQNPISCPPPPPPPPRANTKLTQHKKVNSAFSKLCIVKPKSPCMHPFMLNLHRDIWRIHA
jgi:hypothetical protein